VRILHTSDWHLGRSFHREGLLGHQARFVDHLLEVVDEEAVDLVVVAGDIYDRALPPVDAVRLADETFARLASSRASVVVTSGNHDSAQRLGFGSRLIDAAGVFIRTDIADVGSPVLLADEHGPVAVYGLPYLDPDAVREPWELAARSHETALAEAMRRVRHDLAARPAGVRSLVLAHAFVAGAQPSESERDISVGGVSRVPVGVFEGVDYTALGHLHGRQTLTDRVRYSGSPMAYSFSEADQVKGSWLVDLDRSGEVRATFVEAPVPRRLGRIRGDLDDLLSDPRHAAAEDAWVQVTLTDASRPLQAMERLRRRFPHALVLAFDPRDQASGLATTPRLSRRTAHEVALDFVAEVRGAPATPAESSLLRDACEAAAHDPDADLARV
jgi:exonuclease SbcD